MYLSQCLFEISIQCYYEVKVLDNKKNNS